MHGLQLDGVSDREIVHKLEALVRQERQVTLGVVLHLGEMEARKLHVSLGYGSLFDYATQRLRYSAAAACRRIRVARCLRRHPEALQLLRRNEINLSTLGLACRILTDENAGCVLQEIRHKTQREVEAVVARYAPERLIHDRVRPVTVAGPDDSTGHDRSGHAPGDLFAISITRDPDMQAGPTRARALGASQATPAISSENPEASRSDSEALSDRIQNSGPRRVGSSDLGSRGTGNSDLDPRSVESSGPDPKNTTSEAGTRGSAARFAFRFAASPCFMAKFEEARALLSNRPGRRVSFEAVFEAGLDAFLDRRSPTRRKARREKRSAKNQAPASQPERVESRAPTGKLEPDESRVTGGQVGRVGASAGRIERADAGVSAAKTKRVESRVPGGKILPRRSRHVPVDVRDVVYVRDEGRCTYVGPNGRRCGVRFRVQVDHIEPFGLRGPSTEPNLRLLCAAHNFLEAERVYGREKIRSFVARNPQPLRR